MPPDKAFEEKCQLLPGRCKKVEVVKNTMRFHFGDNSVELGSLICELQEVVFAGKNPWIRNANIKKTGHGETCVARITFRELPELTRKLTWRDRVFPINFVK
ncbi:MAG: hypothetical protein NTY61_03700 [Candidatus Parcubacteria bacterium]|nr:hypothetical protein [Candidatus Parcubacteria bacterium]